MYAVRANSEIFHPVKRMGEEYITPCGVVVPESYIFDQPQQDFPISHLVRRRPRGRRLCFRCESFMEAHDRRESFAQVYR